MLRILMCLLLSIIACSSVAADSMAEKKPELKDLLIAVNSIHYPPYEYVENGVLKGLHIDMVRMVGKRKGFNVEFIQLPRARILKLMKNGGVDGVTFIGKSQALDNSDLTWFHGGNGLSVSAARLMVRKDSKLRFRGNRSDLDGLKLAVLRGFQYGEELLTEAKFEVFEADSVDQLKRLVKAGRVDAAVVLQSEWFEYKRNGSDDYKILQRPVSHTWTWLGFSKVKYGEYFSFEFGEAIKEFVNTSEYNQLLKEYIK
jgi:polar amino acid transport system substrate-binding protein